MSGEGARLYGGRWNSPERPVHYTAEHAALAVLEVRVHLDLDWDVLPDDYVLMEIDTGDLAFEEIVTGGMSGARASEAGDAWLQSNQSPVLNVPSIIIPENYNFLINPAHPASKGVTVKSIRPFAFDARLWHQRT